MKIYVSHKRGPAQNDLYSLLKSVKGHEFILPHESNSELFDSKNLFQNKQCDLVLAEVSEPSTGQGIELGWASMLMIPIICVYRKGSCPANSLRSISATLIEYDGYDSLKTYLENTKDAMPQ